MANHKSAEKRVRQNIKRNEINRSNRSKLRTQIKSLHRKMEVSHQAQISAIISRLGLLGV